MQLSYDERVGKSRTENERGEETPIIKWILVDINQMSLIQESYKNIFVSTHGLCGHESS